MGHRAQGDGEVCITDVEAPLYGTSGIDPDLMEATRKATRHVIDHPHRERGLSRAEAYIRCSAAVDLEGNEVVDEPNWVVSAYLAESLVPTWHYPWPSLPS